MTTHDDSPASSSTPSDWRAVIDTRWEALRREAFGLDPGPRRKLSMLARECQTLVSIAAWFEAHGNITQAAQQIGTSRRALRERVVAWRKHNPELVPSPSAKPTGRSLPIPSKTTPATPASRTTTPP